MVCITRNLPTVNTKKGHKLNRLQHLLPEGLIADAAWLEAHGYSGALRSKYVASGWLTQPARGVYARHGNFYRWEAVAISLQSLLRVPVAVGGSTALNLQGFAHYLSLGGERTVHFYAEAATPGWLEKLELFPKLVVHRATKLFLRPGIRLSVELLPKIEATLYEDVERLMPGELKTIPWGQWAWPLLISTPERAVFELLDELPRTESFDHVDVLMEGLGMLSPKRVQQLLEACDNVKVKRLFLWFAERHNHSWWARLDLSRVNLGSGKRMIVRGGRLDTKYQITVPETLHGGR